MFNAAELANSGISLAKHLFSAQNDLLLPKA